MHQFVNLYRYTRMPLIRTSFLKTLIFQSSRLNYSTVINPSSSSSSSSSSSKKASETSKNDNSAPKTPVGLSNILKEMIKTNGPIPLSHYMSQCLSNPEYGYYTTRDPLDSTNKYNIESDFVTSPEISSTFGEICGVWYFSMFLTQLKQISMKEKSNKNPDVKKFDVHDKIIRIVEFGPGRGTLMFDMLRVLNKFIGAKNEIEVVMVEVSDVLRDEQKSLLCQVINDPEPDQAELTIWNNKIQWLQNEKDVEELISKEPPEKYINFVMAHEFFDALPINRFCKTSKGWREYLVDTYDHQKQATELPNVTLYKSSYNGVSQQEFNLVLSPYITPYCSFLNILPRYKDLPENSNVEVSFKTYDYISVVSKLISNKLDNGYQLGSGLIIDYGPMDTIPSNSLRGISKHKLVNPFIKPGEIDLTSDVDFLNIQNLFSEYFDCDSHIAEQGDWLNSMGLNFRIEQVLESEYDKLQDDKEVFEKRKSDILKSYERLTGKGIRDMGSVYKVMGVIPNNAKVLPVGFGGDI